MSKNTLVTNAQPNSRAGRPMTAADEVVFLLDVDSTPLDNDRIAANLNDYLRREIGGERRYRYWTIFEALSSAMRITSAP